MSGLRSAVGFLTPLPAGSITPDRRTLPWFPVVGALIGLAVGGAWLAADEAWPALLAAGLAVAADVALTGGLHLDGLADTADGVLPHADGPERRLAIKRAPDIGAFGAVAVVVVLLLRWSALAVLVPDVLLVAALWSAARAAMAVALMAVPYVGGGLGAAFLGSRRALVAGGGLLVPVALAVATDRPVVTVGAVAAGWLTAAGVVVAARRRLGGVTGDVLGAAGVIAETVGLLLASAEW